MSESTCPRSGCARPPSADGLCIDHYIEPLLPLAMAFRPRTKALAIVRFLHHVDLSGGPDACWPYQNSVHPAGYATFFDRGNRKAHRWAYEHFIGPIPEGMDVDHTCCAEDCPTPGWGDPHRRCANPRHLRVKRPTLYDYACAGCGKPVTRAQPSKWDRVYCSTECRKDRVAKTCPVCRKDFNIPASNEDRYQTCSWACKNVGTVYVNCERCGKRFPDDTRQSWTRRHCSEECRRPPLMIACQTCGKEFRKSACEENKRFCSVSCVRQFVGETRLEARVRVALEALGIGFTQEYPFRRWSIDFAIPKHNVAIEADGDYWHTILADRDAKRDAAMNAAGWTVVRLSEADVNSARDLGQFILARVHAATGLEQADLVGAARVGSRQRRRASQQVSRGVGRSVAEQTPLWD